MLNLFLAVLSLHGVPSDHAVHQAVGLPVLNDTVVVKEKRADGVLLPLPHLGFVTVPVTVHDCSVYRQRPNAPAGVPPAVWGSVRVISLR